MRAFARHIVLPRRSFVAGLFCSFVSLLHSVLTSRSMLCTRLPYSLLVSLFILLPLFLRFLSAQSIREHALHVLRLLAELMPNELLNAHKTAVLVALAAAIEDRKRCVRRAAVRCRNTWYV
jgi:hypothetical protein